MRQGLQALLRRDQLFHRGRLWFHLYFRQLVYVCFRRDRLFRLGHQSLQRDRLWFHLWFRLRSCLLFRQLFHGCFRLGQLFQQDHLCFHL